MKGRILTSLLTVIALTGLQAQNIPAVPRLVVGLTIDQLRTDYIEAFSALYGERGFKRLWREGRIYRNAEYDFINVDKSSAVAAIYSALHLIPTESWGITGWTAVLCESLIVWTMLILWVFTLQSPLLRRK